MVKVEIEVEAATAVELVEALSSLAFNQDSRHFIVLGSLGFVDDDGVRPRWSASLTQHMPTIEGADDATAS
jgi:hypothetical protein